MALLFSESFEAGAVGDTIANGTAFGYTVTGTGPASITGSAFDGTKALDVNTTAAVGIRTFRRDHTAAALTWDAFTFVVPASPPPADATIWQGYGPNAAAAETLISAIQYRSTGTMRLRDTTLAVTGGETPALAPGTYQIATKCAPGSATGLRMKIYDASGTLVFDSADRASTVSGVTTKTNSRIGLLLNAQTRAIFDWHRCDNATEPARRVVATPVASAGADQTVDGFTETTFTLSASGGSGSGYSYSFTQTGGSTDNVTIAGTGTTRRVRVGGYLTDTPLTFALVVTDGAGATSPADTVVLTVRKWPHRIRVDGVWRFRVRRYRRNGAWTSTTLPTSANTFDSTALTWDSTTDSFDQT